MRERISIKIFLSISSQEPQKFIPINLRLKNMNVLLRKKSSYEKKRFRQGKIKILAPSHVVVTRLLTKHFF